LNAQTLFESKFSNENEGYGDEVDYKSEWHNLVVELIKESVGDEVTFNMIHPGVAFQVNFQTDGLNEVAPYLSTLMAKMR
jgi:hypothetical protein